MLAELVLHQRAPPSRRGLGEALRGGDAHGDAPAAAVEGLPPIPRFQGLPGPLPALFRAVAVVWDLVVVYTPYPSVRAPAGVAMRQNWA